MRDPRDRSSGSSQTRPKLREASTPIAKHRDYPTLIAFGVFGTKTASSTDERCMKVDEIERASV